MSRTRNRSTILGATTLLVLLPLAAASAAPPPTDSGEYPFARVSALAELGFLGVPSHTVQFGSDGTEFDYVGEGGQNNLFLFARLSLELELAGKHTVVLLYQPLNIESSVLLNRDVTIDTQLFPRDTALDLRYGFDFYRASYLYDFTRPESPHELAIGLSLQIRNATIDFTSADGKLRASKRDIGPVPIIKFRGRYQLTPRVWLGGEVDGFYAPIKYINGGKSDVEGAIVDLSVRSGFRVRPNADLFVNLRYLAGGASGTSKDSEDRGDGFVSNWLHFITLSVGAAWSS